MNTKAKIFADADHNGAGARVLEPAVYWQTKYGSVVERQAGPDAKGWMTVRRLSDDAIRQWNAADMRPLTSAEAVELLTTTGAA